MNIIVFYRSKEQTNSIVSSTRQDSRIINLQKASINIDYLNLDKRNYQKYLKQLEVLPNKVFLWFDEEIVSDYIKEIYSSIEIVSYDKDSTIKYDEGTWGTTKEYRLTNLLLESISHSFKNIDVWEVTTRPYDIIKRNISEFTYKSSQNPNIFDIYDKAVNFAKDNIKQTIEWNKHNIENAEKCIKNCTADIKKLETNLKKIM